MFKRLVSGLLVLLLPHLIIQSEVVKQDDIKICLSMIVLDDAEVIEKCLDSVKNFVDCVSICDLGSSDGTLVIIDEFFIETGIPVVIHKGRQRSAWQDRTLSVKAAQKMIKDLGFSLESTYLLDLTPDMALKIGSGFTRANLKEDAYLLLERSSSLSCSSYNMRLLRASIAWEGAGASEGYWTLAQKKPPQIERLYTLTIEDHAPDDYKKKKLQHELKLLTQLAAKEPSEPRHLFYLAQTHKNLKNYQEAILHYKERIAKEEARDEVWFSHFMIGECYESLGQWEPALFWYLEAYRQNPDRADSLLKIANYYRLKGQNDLAYLFAKHGSKIPLPKSPTLLGFDPLSDYHFDEELSIASYYTRFKPDGFAAANDLILKKSPPWHIKDQTYRNMLFYMENLPVARKIPIEFDFPLIQPGLEERYHPMNPSIQRTDTGYKVICRTVNYTQTGAKIFNTVDETGIFRTRNFLLHYDKNFKLQSYQEIIEDLERERIHSFNLEGIDDCRIFDFQGSSWFTCTTSDTNPAGNFQISLCKLADAPKEDGVVEVEKLLPLLGPDPYKCEKNWLPFLKDNELHLIYTYDPFTIYKPNLETGACETVIQYENTLDLYRFRGSAAPIKFDDGYLMLVHEVVMLPDYQRVYLHRFLYLDQNLVIKKLSKVFTFDHLGVEFCCSMTCNHAETDLIIAVGLEDREAWLYSLSLESVRSMLTPMSSNGKCSFLK